ncbi:MAG: hypothetical protein ACI835_004216 [Planctomycetota bacterium]|jgi:hypothetical protein
MEFRNRPRFGDPPLRHPFPLSLQLDLRGAAISLEQTAVPFVAFNFTSAQLILLNRHVPDALVGPLVCTARELHQQTKSNRDTAAHVFEELACNIPYLIGTMIKLLRAGCEACCGASRTAGGGLARIASAPILKMMQARDECGCCACPLLLRGASEFLGSPSDA